MADEKQRLNGRLVRINEDAKAQIDEYNETLHRLEALKTVLSENNVRMAELDNMHEETRLLIKAEKSKRDEELRLRQAKILEQDRRELSKGNERIAAEVEASGVTSLPGEDCSGEIDPELKGFRSRRAEIDQELRRLSELLETEHQEFPGRVSNVAHSIDELTKIKELHAAEDPVANEEISMQDRESKALAEDDELLGHKKDDIQTPLLVAKKRHEEAMRLTITLRNGVRAREAALTHRSDASVQRCALRDGLKQEHEERVSRTTLWLQEEVLRIQRLEELGGIPVVPDSSELGQKRRADNKASEAAQFRLGTHLKALNEDVQRCDTHIIGSDAHFHIAEAAQADRLLQEFSELDVAGLLKEDTSKEANDTALNAREEGKFRRELEQAHTDVKSLHRRIVHELTTEKPHMERLSKDLREQRDMLLKDIEDTITLKDKIRQYVEQDIQQLSAKIATRDSLVQSKVGALNNDIQSKSSSVEQLILSCAKEKGESDIRTNQGCQHLGATVKSDVADKHNTLKQNIRWYQEMSSYCTTVANKVVANLQNSARPEKGDRVQVISGMHEGRFGQVLKDGKNDFIARPKFLVVFRAEEEDYVRDTQVTRAGTKPEKFKEEWRMLENLQRHTVSDQSFRDASRVGGECIERLEKVGGAMAKVKQYMAQAEEAKGVVGRCRKDAQSLFAPHGGTPFDRWQGQKISQHPSLAHCHGAISKLRERALELDRLVGQVEKELHDSSKTYEVFLSNLKGYKESVGQLRTIFDGEYQAAQNKFNVALEQARLSFYETS